MQCPMVRACRVESNVGSSDVQFRLVDSEVEIVCEALLLFEHDPGLPVGG